VDAGEYEIFSCPFGITMALGCEPLLEVLLATIEPYWYHVSSSPSVDQEMPNTERNGRLNR
jgi:hypothetical protein